jgi:hypothetical protein
MWGNKKSHTPQAADPEPKNWQTNQPPAGAIARLGSSLHVKGEISGNEVSFAKTPRQPTFIHVTCYTASLYVVDFKCCS